MAGKRLTPAQDRFLLYVLEESKVKAEGLPWRLKTSAISLIHLGYVKPRYGRYELTEPGQARANLLKTWQEDPESRPKRGGVLRKGRISSPLHHGAGDD